MDYEELLKTHSLRTNGQGPRVIGWVDYESTSRVAGGDMDLGGWGGCIEKGDRWSNYIADLAPEKIPYFEALRTEIIARRIRHGGDWHQNDPEGVPVFDDGQVATFSYRAWGDLMAAIWSSDEGRDYGYMDFYMESLVPSTAEHPGPSSLTECPDCRREMRLVDRTTFTGDDLRTYRCDACQKERTINSGRALWKALSDAGEEEARASSDRQPDSNVVCSGCAETVEATQTTVVPYYNSDVGRYATAFRCPKCRASSLTQIRARIEATSDTMELRSAAALLCRHGVAVHEYLRADRDEAIKDGVLKCIDLIENGTVRLRVGDTNTGS